MKKGIIGILLALFLAFAFILGASSLIGLQFGKTGEMLTLCAAAIVLFIVYKKSKGDQ